MNINYTQKTLADKAMLVRFKVKRARQTARDDVATSYVESQSGLSDIGQFNKKLFKNSDRFAKMNTAINEVIKYHKEHTVPWLDGGVRMLPAPLYLEYTAGIRGLMAQAEALIQDFQDNWDYEVSRDVARLNTLANMDDYDFRPDIGFEMRFQPVPQDSDFRVAISDADKQSMQDALDEAGKAITHDLLSRMLEPVQALVKKLDEYQGDKGQRWHDTLVTTVQDLTSTLRRLNINDDQRVTKLLDDVGEAMKDYTSDSLKHSHQARVDAKRKLDNILAAFG